MMKRPRGKDDTDSISEPTRLLLKPREAAEALAISPRTLWGMTASGEIPAIRIGCRGVRYSVEDLRTFIAERRPRLE